MARLEGESIYRRIAVRMHADEKVQRLVRPQPCGRSLWWELLAGEQTDVVPGLFRIGEAAFAEQLGWSMRGFRDAWTEVVDAGLPVRADWSARLVWVQNALRHNMPASPKAVLHWKDCWRDRLPECSLKNEARTYIEATLEAFSKPYAEAFREVCWKGTPKTTRYQDQSSVSSSSKQEDVGSSLSGESEGRESTACESVDNPEHIPANLNESERSHVLTLFRDGKATEARDYLASLQGGRGIPIQKKSGSGGVS